MPGENHVLFPAGLLSAGSPLRRRVGRISPRIRPERQALPTSILHRRLRDAGGGGGDANLEVSAVNHERSESEIPMRFRGSP